MGKFKFTPENRSLFSLRSAWPLTKRELAAVLGLKDGNLLSQFESGQKAALLRVPEEMAAASGAAEGWRAALRHRLLWSSRPPGEGRRAAPRARSHVGERRRSGAPPSPGVRGRGASPSSPQCGREGGAGAARGGGGVGAAGPVWRRRGDLAGPSGLRTPAFAAGSARRAPRRVPPLRGRPGARGFAVSMPGRCREGGAAQRAVGFSRPFVANACASRGSRLRRRELAKPGAMEGGDPSDRAPGGDRSSSAEQQRFPSARCIKRALASRRPAAAAAHILLRRRHLDAMGDTAGPQRRWRPGLVEAAAIRPISEFRFKVVNNSAQWSATRKRPSGCRSARMAINRARSST